MAKTHDDQIALMGEQFRLLREAFSSRPRRQHLREDVQNVDNSARTELQQAMSQAIGGALEISTTSEEAGVRTVQGVLHLGQDVRFSFTNQQPDGCYIECNNLELSERTAEILGKLQAYFTTWYSQTAGGEEPGVAPEGTAPAPGIGGFA
jgi:hypothetical protein